MAKPADFRRSLALFSRFSRPEPPQQKLPKSLSHHYRRRISLASASRLVHFETADVQLLNRLNDKTNQVAFGHSGLRLSTPANPPETTRDVPVYIDKSLHYLLDMAFREDACQVSRGFAPENLANIHKLARP